MSKTIAYVGNFAFPDRNASGKRVLGNCLLLKQLGFVPICIGSGDGSISAYEGIVCHSIRTSNSERVLGNGAGRITDILEDYYTDCELKAVILYGALFTQKENCRIIRWCREKQIEVYYDQVDWFELNWHNPLRAFIRSFNHFLLNNRVIPACDGVICISSYLARYHRSKGRKTVVIPPLATQRKESSTMCIDNGPLRFVYAGTSSDVARPVRQWKDRLDLMFSALAEAAKLKGTRPFQFDVFGLTREQYIRMFPKALRKSGIEALERLGKCVAFHGIVTNAEAMAGVARADFTVLIRDKKRSTMAGFPTKVSESISCGTPVICTDTSDLRQYICEGYNGFICENERLMETYGTVLRLKDEQLLQMKNNCLDNRFYYKNFFGEMKSFLGKQYEFLQENH